MVAAGWVPIPLAAPATLPGGTLLLGDPEMTTLLTLGLRDVALTEADTVWVEKEREREEDRSH